MTASGARGDSQYKNLSFRVLMVTSSFGGISWGVTTYSRPKRKRNDYNLLLSVSISLATCGGI